MFEHCRAFIAVDHINEAQLLGTLASSLGFGEISSHFPSVARAGGHIRLTYFLADARVGDDALLELLEAVREQKRQKLCYSPVIVFTADVSEAARLHYVRLGFDDVVAFPLPHHELAARLAEQIGCTKHYVETRDYLGPDRRSPDGADRRIIASPYTQVLFERDPRHGIRVLGREQRGHRFRPQPTGVTHFMPKLFGTH